MLQKALSKTHAYCKPCSVCLTQQVRAASHDAKCSHQKYFMLHPTANAAALADDDVPPLS